MSPKKLILLQIPMTLLILGFMSGNEAKLLALLVLWILTFGRLNRAEMALVLIACPFFTGMNIAALKQGIFAFRNPDFLGMPIYELFMWGFYLLHTKRLLADHPPQDRRLAVWTLAIFFATAFATIPDATLLLSVTGALLLIGLILFHDPMDIAYTGYMILLGAAIEYMGVWTGQWHYPGNPSGGVPFWFITLWGGVGLLLRRLALPILDRLLPTESKANQ
ncbi:MAG: hypothetical protein L6420_01925 [Elusimicrobia bacterium]|nr:hypothetical protein [Candidatus Omnitrophota bacterium]MCG2725010.1 hypothetical protein [Elusimicrobiota bacterium]